VFPAPLNSLWQKILDSLFPIHCLGGCGTEGEWACANCRSTIVARPRLISTKHTALDRLIGAYSYAHPLIKGSIKEFKYHGAAPLGAMLSGLTESAVAKLATLFPKDAIVVPVPLHATRLRERGFNQAERLSEAVARALESSVQTPLTRTRRTGYQAKLSTEERKQNCKDAFTCAPVSGDIVLVDDVVTTGATMNEAAKALKKAGARSVIGFALAYG